MRFSDMRRLLRKWNEKSNYQQDVFAEPGERIFDVPRSKLPLPTFTVFNIIDEMKIAMIQQLM